MIAVKLLEECGLATRDDHKTFPTRRGAYLIIQYEKLIVRLQAEISRLRQLLEERDGYEDVR